LHSDDVDAERFPEAPDLGDSRVAGFCKHREVLAGSNVDMANAKVGKQPPDSVILI